MVVDGEIGRGRRKRSTLAVEDRKAGNLEVEGKMDRSELQSREIWDKVKQVTNVDESGCVGMCWVEVVMPTGTYLRNHNNSDSEHLGVWESSKARYILILFVLVEVLDSSLNMHHTPSE